MTTLVQKICLVYTTTRRSLIANVYTKPEVKRIGSNERTRYLITCNARQLLLFINMFQLFILVISLYLGLAI